MNSYEMLNTMRTRLHEWSSTEHIQDIFFAYRFGDISVRVCKNAYDLSIYFALIIHIPRLGQYKEGSVRKAYRFIMDCATKEEFLAKARAEITIQKALENVQ